MLLADGKSRASGGCHHRRMAYYVSNTTALKVLSALAVLQGPPVLGQAIPSEPSSAEKPSSRKTPASTRRKGRCGQATLGKPRQSAKHSGQDLATHQSSEDSNSVEPKAAQATSALTMRKGTVTAHVASGPGQASVSNQTTGTDQTHGADQSKRHSPSEQGGAGRRVTPEPEFAWLKYARTDSLDDASISLTDAERTLYPALSYICGCDAHELQIDLLVSPGSERYRVSGVVPHQWKVALPRGSFIWIGDGVRVASPEFCFLQMASHLSLRELVALGYSMCGTYQPADIGKGFVHRRPLTSTNRLRRYLDIVAPGTPGLEKARRALTHIMDGSNSPLETCAAMELTLPGMMGGLQLPHPSLNARIELSADARRLTGQASCVVDALWPKAHFALEILGAEYHKDTGRDTRRLLGLEHDGFVVRELTAEQVRDVNHIAEVARQVRQGLGMRTDRHPSSTRVQERRTELRNSLFPPPKHLPSGEVTFPKPEWALPANFSACIAEEEEYQRMLRGNARRSGKWPTGQC